MIGRLFSLVLGLALIALGVLINRPDLYGPSAPHLSLGLYETWRQIVGMVIGGVGLVILIAAIVRQGAPKKRKRDTTAMTFDEPAPAHDHSPSAHSSDGDFTIHSSASSSAMDGPSSRGGSAVASPLW
jgi:hypothetical protein